MEKIILNEAKIHPYREYRLNEIELLNMVAYAIWSARETEINEYNLLDCAKDIATYIDDLTNKQPEIFSVDHMKKHGIL